MGEILKKNSKICEKTEKSEKSDVIVSTSTPIGRGAIAIVRMSGSESLNIALKIFHSKNLDAQNIKPRYMYFGNLLLDEGNEECLMVFFRAPFSYTGEDVVEFQVHGGVLLVEKVLQLCVKNGARLAEAGEFSKRAFLNGKITLEKAEAIIGEINAESERELQSSLQVTNGALAEKISDLQDKTKLLLAEIDVGLDYPDETDETKMRKDILSRLQEVQSEILGILQNCESAKYIKNGINVAIVGRTNVGKSSVMNAMLGQNRAIVTDIQGTTRDVVSESFHFKGVKINLFDTAGIRNSTDVVENLGIERSKNSINSADLVLFVLDGSQKFSEQDREIEKLISDTKHLYVVNKLDKKRVLQHFDGEIEISAETGEGVEELKNKILQLVKIGDISGDALVLTNQRQTKILKDAAAIVENITNSKREILEEDYGENSEKFFEKKFKENLKGNYKNGAAKEESKTNKNLNKKSENSSQNESLSLPLDVLSVQLHFLWQTLGKITGKTENEDIIDLIFSKFCLGK